MAKMGISCLPFRSKHRTYCCERGFKCLLSLKNLFRKIKSLRELVHHILNVFGCNYLMYYVDLMSQVPHSTLYFECMSLGNLRNSSVFGYCGHSSSLFELLRKFICQKYELRMAFKVPASGNKNSEKRVECTYDDFSSTKIQRKG